MSQSTTDEFSAWVSIDGMRLPQYGAKATVVKGKDRHLLDCIRGQQMSWFIPKHRREQSIVGKVDVDGIRADSRIHAGTGVKTIDSMYVSDTVGRALIFSKLEYTDEDAYLDTDLRELGDIRVDIWAGRCLGSVSPPGTPNLKRLPTKIHERAKKAISHRVIFGDEFAIAPGEALKSSEFRCDRLLRSFIFKYRPRGFLQAEGIMPSDPKPNARPRKRVAETPEPSASEDEEGVDIPTRRSEESRLEQDELRVKKEELEVQERELQIQKERLRIQKEELRIRLDATKAKTKNQRKKAKLEPQEATLRVKTETIDLT